MIMHVFTKVWVGIFKSNAIDIGVFSNMVDHIIVKGFFKAMLMRDEISLDIRPIVKNMAMGSSEAVWVFVLM